MTKAMVFSVSAVLALTVVLTSGAAAQSAAHVLPKVEKVTVNAPVTLIDNGDSWTLDNGIIKATFPKRDGRQGSGPAS
jgi:hypothetical protein